MPRNSLCSFSPVPLPPPPPCGAWILRRGSLYQKHHSWMRRRPLRKISCHPFLKIFVNLVSSVCGFISTCINVSSLVTEPQYLGEDIIKNVFGPWGGERGGGAEEVLPGSRSAKRDGVGSLGRKRKASSLLLLSPGSLRDAEPVITDKLAEVRLSSLHGGITGVSVCCYLFNGTRFRRNQWISGWKGNWCRW